MAVCPAGKPLATLAEPLSIVWEAPLGLAISGGECQQPGLLLFCSSGLWSSQCLDFTSQKGNFGNTSLVAASILRKPKQLLSRILNITLKYNIYLFYIINYFYNVTYSWGEQDSERILVVFVINPLPSLPSKSSWKWRGLDILGSIIFKRFNLYLFYF